MVVVSAEASAAEATEVAVAADAGRMQFDAVAVAVRRG